MAYRLISVARIPSLLVRKLKPVQPPSRSYLLSRERLVPFIDDDPYVFSKKAIMHHWGAIPILVLTAFALSLEVIFGFKLALTRHDVSYSANSAFCDNLETRQGPWYKPEYLKVIPILAISVVGLILKVGVIILLGLKKDDVWYTKDSAYFENFETRQGRWYKYKSRKWGGRDDYEMPPGAILARTGDVNGPSFSEDKKNNEGDGFSMTALAGHIAVTSVAVGLATVVA